MIRNSVIKIAQNEDSLCLQMRCLAACYIIYKLMIPSNFSSDSEDDKPPALLELPSVNSNEKMNQAKFLSPGVQSRTPLTSVDSFLSRYEDVKKIGEGNNGSVHLYKRIKSGKLFAVKIMTINEETESIASKNFKQVLTLKQCPYLVKYYKMVSSLITKTCYLVMKYYQFPKIDTKAEYPEKEMKNIVRQILQGLKFMHKKNFYHRDIKPDNILYDRENGKIVIVDLGVGRRVKTGQANTIAGSPAYRAPEMGALGYDNKVDIYALGITMYEMVTGFVPFKKSGTMNSSEVKKDIEMKKNESLEYSQPQWKKYSNRLRDLIDRMVKYSPSDRYDASQCLNHPWFIDETIPDPQLDKVEKIKKRGIERDYIKSEAQKKTLLDLKDNSFQARAKKNGNQAQQTTRIIEDCTFIDSETEEQYINVQDFY